MAPCTEHIKAIITKASPEQNAWQPPLPFEFHSIRFGNKYKPGTDDVIDMWESALREDGRVILNVFLPDHAALRPLHEANASVRPLSRSSGDPRVRIDCITLSLYHEAEEAEAFRTWVHDSLTDILTILGRSWDIWTGLPEDVLQGDTLSLDVIGLNLRMARDCMQAVGVLFLQRRVLLTY